MGKPLRPRHGSMQFWPRVRAKTENVQIRSVAKSSEPKLLGFAGYKAGMTHVIYTDTHKTSLTKGEQLSSPVTIVECPAMTVVGVRAYGVTDAGYGVVGQIYAQNMPKEVKAELNVTKIEKKEFSDLPEFDELRAIVATHPSKTGFGRKVPDVFELPVGGNKDAQVAYMSEKLGQEVSIEDVFKPGDLIDSHSVTKGKGFQGSVKRFGVNIRSHKSEKTKRGPGSLGGWKGHMHFMYRNPLAGQTGYHKRTEYNKYLLHVGSDVSQINPKSGISRYGLVKGKYALIMGSLGGPKKRLIKFTPALRPNAKHKVAVPQIEHISQEAQN